MATSLFTDVAYAQTPQRLLRLDLRVPQLEPRPPLVMYIPMGGMRSCVKESAQWWLTERGFAMASIECRVSSEVTAPGPVHDCKAAVRWLRAHAEDYGYRAETIGVWGHSAGGLLAALLATSGNVTELEGSGAHADVSSKVQAACDECGAPHDLAYFARPEVKSCFGPVTENLRLYLGGAVEERLELAAQVSPRTYVSRDTAPMLLIHGDADSVVPVEETIDFHQALEAAGADVSLRILPGLGHSWDYSLTQAEITSFFDRTIRKGS